MRHFPHFELSVLARSEKHVFVLVVVDHFNLLSEATLELDYALALPLDVSDLHESISGSLAVARHS